VLIDGRCVFQDELEALKTKLDKLETERTSLKHENDKLEAKVSTAKRRKVSGSTTLTFDLAMAPSFSGLSPKNVSVAVARRSFSVVGARLKNLQHKKSKRSGRGPASGIIRERGIGFLGPRCIEGGSGIVYVRPHCSNRCAMECR
jgi:hypothetical protein